MQTVIEIIAEVVLVLSSLFLILTILMHKGSGGGLSDMFGGGLSSSAGSSGVAMRNLNRITVVTAVVWLISVSVLGLLPRMFA
ncbi:preprotein translocase subunit SecG [uncultured Varibaculum sp.]|uniref:preprotein translocase subunit SecG n=1 Tax=uncultured Varibaculum sp. TaxID=413896 RepID=UPI002675D71B|nr:preprotein translocase subunit SecG [uncultured Varibaculum sp.]